MSAPIARDGFCMFLPSIPDALQLSDPERNCLGNWPDGARCSMFITVLKVRKLQQVFACARLPEQVQLQMLTSFERSPHREPWRHTIAHCTGKELWEQQLSHLLLDEPCWVFEPLQFVEGLVFVRLDHRVWHVTTKARSKSFRPKRVRKSVAIRRQKCAAVFQSFPAQAPFPSCFW